MVLALAAPGASSAFAAEPAASHITSPANDSYLSVNLDTDPNKTVTVTGTATDSSNNPYTGTVDLDCTAAFGATTYVFSQGASNVTVTAGNFSTDVKVADLAGERATRASSGRSRTTQAARSLRTRLHM